MRKLARFLFVIGALAALSPGCNCSKKASEDKQPVRAPISADTGSRDASGPPPFKPLAGGVESFTAPLGEEVLSLSTSPDGETLLAVTAKTAYVFDGHLRPRSQVTLPGLMRRTLGVAVSKDRAAIIREAPTTQAEGRVMFVDAALGKELTTVTVQGKPTAGVALAGGRLAVLLEEPPGLVVFDAAGVEMGRHGLPKLPHSVQASADGTRIGVAAEGGVAELTLVDGAPKVSTPSTGKFVLSAKSVLPVGAGLLATGADASGRVMALVLGGTEPVSLPLPAGTYLAAVVDESVSRAVIFVNVDGDGKTLRGFVFDTSSWQQVGTVETGPTVADARLSVQGGTLVVPRCDGSVTVDLMALTAAAPRAIRPMGGASDCMLGLHGIQERVASHRGGVVLSWTH